MHTYVNVTQDDISRGNFGSPCGCAVALAVQRAFNRNNISVSLNNFYLSDTLAVPIGEVAPEVRQFINQFDNGCKVEPFTFSLILSLPEVQACV